MKKTICKSIHEADENLFIYIEDIQKVYIDEKLLIICPKDTTYTFDILFDSKEKAESVHESIIKELEDYYKENHYEWDIELMDLVYTSAIKHKLNDMNEAGWELVSTTKVGHSQLVIIHKRMKNN